MKSTHIRTALDKNTSLHALTQHARFLRHIDGVVQHQLSFSLQLHCKVANYRENILYLHVDSPARATRLRFALPELVNKLKATREFKELIEISLIQEIKTPPRKALAAQPARRLSIESAQQIECLAEQVDDSKLANALRRLAKRAE